MTLFQAVVLGKEQYGQQNANLRFFLGIEIAGNTAAQFCGNCGATNAREAAFCSACGSRLPWSAPAAPPYLAHAPRPRQSWNRRAIAAIGLAAFLVGALLLVQRNSTSPSVTSPSVPTPATQLASGEISPAGSLRFGSSVVFTSDAPSSDGAKTCKLGTEVTAIKIGDPVYVNIFYKDRLTNETVTLTILKDGTKLDSTPLPAAESNGIDCLEDQSNWGEILQNQGAGTYEFQLTDSTGRVVADGALQVR